MIGYISNRLSPRLSFFLSPRLSACNLRRTEEEGRFSDFRFELSLSLFLISFFIFLIPFLEFSFFVFRKMILFFIFSYFPFFLIFVLLIFVVHFSRNLHPISWVRFLIFVSSSLSLSFSNFLSFWFCFHFSFFVFRFSFLEIVKWFRFSFFQFSYFLIFVWLIFVSLIDFRCSFFSKSPSSNFMGDELISWYELTHTLEMMDGDGRLAAEIWSTDNMLNKHYKIWLLMHIKA